MAFFTYTRTVQFADSDAAGVAHFSRVACFVEEAEHAWLAAKGFPVRAGDPDALQWPRVRFDAEYLLPLRPFDGIRVELSPEEPGTSSVTWTWSVWRYGTDDCAARGRMKTVCCRLRDGRMAPSPLPDELRRFLLSG